MNINWTKQKKSFLSSFSTTFNVKIHVYLKYTYDKIVGGCLHFQCIENTNERDL